jgi:hypothetical protein
MNGGLRPDAVVQVYQNERLVPPEAAIPLSKARLDGAYYR